MKVKKYFVMFVILLMTLSSLAMINIYVKPAQAQPRNLTVQSTPFVDINFTIDATSYTTNTTVALTKDVSYTVRMPLTWMNGTDQWTFGRWEDNSTNRVRTVLMDVPQTIIAFYVHVKVYVNQPLGYIPGVPVGTHFQFNITITTSGFVDTGSPSIVGWSVDLQVDPDVISINNVAPPPPPFPPPPPDAKLIGGVKSYVMKDFGDWYGFTPSILASPPNVTTGFWNDIAETYVPLPAFGWGDYMANTHYGRPATLITIEVTSKSETAYSLIDLQDVTWLDANNKWHTVDEVIDGHYTQPVYHNLTVESTPIDGINFTIDSTTYATNTSVILLEGNRTVTMPSTWIVGADQYTFVEWEDNSTNTVRTLNLTSNTTITATYEAKNYTLTVNSEPITGVNFTIDSTTYATNTSVILWEGNRTVSMPSFWMNGTDQYKFVEWEDNSTNRVRTINLTSNITITATYELADKYTLTVNSEPITGVNFTIDSTTYTTNTSVILWEGNRTVSMPSTWMVGADQYNFVEWEDNSTNRVRTINLTSNITITATYKLAPKILRVNSEPITGVDFTIGSTTYTTNLFIYLWKGNYTVSMPSTWMVGADQYNFVEWEDNSTDPVRTISLTSNTIITATYELADKYTLTVNSEPITGVDFTIDSTTYATNTSVILWEGNRTVSMPSTWMVGADQYNFVEWENNSTNRVRTINLTSNITITATYERVMKNYTLTVNSEPITGVNFTVGSTTYATDTSISLLEGNYTVSMPSTWMVGTDQYKFVEWEDNSTNRVRTISLLSNTTITATYVKLVPPVASFTFSPAEPIVTETVTFNASASTDSDGTIVNYAWEFGDGDSDTGVIAEHAYETAGDYNVTLTVTDNDGLTHTITKTITVKEAPPSGIPLELILIAAGVIVVIIVAIVVYYLKIMRQKPE